MKINDESRYQCSSFSSKEMTNGTDTKKFKLSGTDKVEDIGKESRVAPKLLSVSEKGLTIT